MLELSALRMAIEEWEDARDTPGASRAAKRARVQELAVPAILQLMFAALDEWRS